MTSNQNEILYALALTKAKHIGDIYARKLIAKLGSAEAVFKEKPKNLSLIDGIGENLVKEISKTNLVAEAETEMQYIDKEDINLWYFKDENYPKRLNQCQDAPILVFNRGNFNIRNKPIISIVGTRKITAQGVDFCNRLVEDLAPLNPVIVSGFAFGTDITAHKAAIEHNLQNIAVLGHGLNKLYPAVHAKYIKSIEQNGGFITDFTSEANFDRKNFVKRNRIIAGMTEATIVVESAEKGGSLITADFANQYNREVFAVPGRPSDRFSLGCNNLIKKQQAHLITCAADIVYLLNWDIEKEKAGKQQSLFVNLNEEEKKVVAVIADKGKEELDNLVIKTNIPGHQLASILLNLELKGKIRPLPGKQYETI